MAQEGTFRTNAPFAAVLFLFLGTFHPLCPAGGRGRGHLPVVHGRFHPLCPTDGRPDTSRGRHATAGTRRANCTHIHAFRPRRRFCSNPHRPGLDLHQPGKICIDRVPLTQAQPRSACLLVSTRKPAASAGPVDAARTPRRCPGHSIPFRLFEAAQPPQTGVAGSPQDRHARRNDDGNDAEQDEGGEKTQTQRKNKLGAQLRR